MLTIINQLFEIEQKLLLKADMIAERNFKRIYHELDSMGYQLINPLNRAYKETDTDMEVTFSGQLAGKLVVTRVLKPIIYLQKNNEQFELAQKGIVIVEGEGQ